jgi:pyrroloquinoline quinone biosynthesis protein B
MFCLVYSSKKEVNNTNISAKTFSTNSTIPEPSLVVLGTIQDAGSPHIACKKSCCKDLFDTPDPDRKVVSLGIIDHENQKTFLIEATPDISSQLKNLKRISGIDKELPDGIFLTHAHIGHYTGLMYLGKEAINASEVPVFVMPRMKIFLESNGPWSQLVDSRNIILEDVKHKKEARTNSAVSFAPILVPHRDEYSETVGYFLEGPSKKVLFVPDIDKWEKWDIPVTEALMEVDYAFIDATFYSGDEINTRDISEIPHPFIIESMDLLDSLPTSEKNKIHFIHFNHTNPVLDPKSDAYQTVIEKGYHIARINDVFEL